MCDPDAGGTANYCAQKLAALIPGTEHPMVATVQSVFLHVR